MSGELSELFGEPIAAWFAARYGEPTDVQVRAWPEIAAGRHVLVTAPTGSGKTLAAFLFGLSRLITGEWPAGGTRVLYVSPLKALNTDIRRNLLGPLAELHRWFGEAGEPCPEVRVMTRSGDTLPAERRRLIKRPPGILITTPESLNLMLAAPAARRTLTELRAVILDEIHAVAGSKRGTHLITAVERLVPLSGEFQRLALSATVRPLEAVARFVGGYADDRPRPVTVIRSTDVKELRTAVRFPAVAVERAPDQWWPAIAEAVREIVAGHRSTLVFTNTRRHCEKLTLLLNRGQTPPLAYAHHGSLSRETRAVVESRLKRGELRAIVATASLELGIDIGALDEVVLVETPPSVSSAVQRIGRAGHAVGEISRGTLFPLHGRDFLHAAVMTRCLAELDLEAARIVEAPLDVLAQVVAAMGGVETWDLDELYVFIRRCAPYRELSRRAFDLVLAMLAGRYAETRLPALQPKVVIDKVANTITAREGTLRQIYQSGGTIPDRGYYALRQVDSRARLGELDEEFVWERKPGETFVFGTQTWRIEQITHNDVLVSPAAGAPMTPFWRADALSRGSHFSVRVAEFLESLEVRLDEPDLAAELVTERGLDDGAAAELLRWLRLQHVAVGAALPHRHHLLIETIDPHGSGPEATRVVLHTLWGGAVNRPFALALAAAWEERQGEPLSVHAGDDAVVIVPPAEVEPAEWLALVEPDRVEELLRAGLEGSGLFGARFRENAGRALLLPRGDPARRMPLWLTRARAKKLHEAVAGYGDFPLLVETWRTCLRDEFELEALRERLDEVRSGTVRVSCVTTPAPSPFAADVVWHQTNVLMYLDDTPAGRRPGVAEDLLREVVFSPNLRPQLPAALAAEFAARLQRTAAGYAPRSALELLECVQERLLLAEDAWTALLEAITRDGGDPAAMVAELADRLARVEPPGAAVAGVAAVENLPRLRSALGLADLPATTLAGLTPVTVAPADDEDGDPAAELIAQWLQFHGPTAPARIEQVTGLAPDMVTALLEGLAAERRVVIDTLTDSGPEREVCDAEHLERLLRLARRAARPEFTSLPASRLPLLLARQQGLTRRGRGVEAVQQALEPLLGWSAPAAQWETELLPARLDDYQAAWLDSLMQSSELLWVGTGERQVTFALPELLDLIREPVDQEPEPALSPGRHSFGELLAATGQSSRALTDRLWSAVWAGRVTNDTALALRRGVASRFAAGEPSPRRAARRWQAERPFAGLWREIPAACPPADPLDALERDKDRVRLLLDRYGVLARELLAREAPALQWSRLFRALRLMELSGELLAGRFFEGLSGPQFTTPALLAILRGRLPDDAIYWLNAADPASLCGAGIEGLEHLPDRRPTTTLVCHGDRLVVTATRSGKELRIAAPPDHPRLADYLAFLSERQHRAVLPLGTVTIETINDQPADESPYLDILRRVFRVSVGYRRVQVWRG